MLKFPPLGFELPDSLNVSLMPTGTCSWHTANDLSFPPGAITNQRASAIHLEAATVEKEAPPHLKGLTAALRSDELKASSTASESQPLPLRIF